MRKEVSVFCLYLRNEGNLTSQAGVLYHGPLLLPHLLPLLPVTLGCIQPRTSFLLSWRLPKVPGPSEETAERQRDGSRVAAAGEASQPPPSSRQPSRGDELRAMAA